MKHVVVGTAGHIDHGKTELVKALTGVNTDRFKEEQERGITIDIGFAPLPLGPDLTVGFVDVPGHEKFVKNMLAGIWGIDLVLLVVAADESIMPQTREHFEICSLLRVKRGLVALTKVDLVDPDIAELASLEVREFIRGSFLDEAPILPVSSKTRAGLERLTEEIGRAAREVEPGRPSSLLRLPVDRAFSMRGFGTVITGTLVSGTIADGDEVALYPEERVCRVRGLQAHNAPVKEAGAGQRTAVNLGGVDASEVERGHVLGRPGQMRASRLLDVKLSLLAGAPGPLKDLGRVRFHQGTSELLARVRLLSGEPELAPGRECFAQVRLEKPGLSMPGDRFVIRRYSPTVTIGGGVVLDAHPVKHKGAPGPELLDRLTRLERADPMEALKVFLESEPMGISLRDLALRAGRAVGETGALIGSLPPQAGALSAGEGPSAVLIDARMGEKIEEGIVSTLREYHRANPLRPGMPLEELRERALAGAGAEISRMILDRLAAAGTVRVRKDSIGLAGHEVTLSPVDQELMTGLDELFLREGLNPPTLEELAPSLGLETARAEKMVHLLLASGRLVKIKDGRFFHTEAIEALKRRLWLFRQERRIIDIGSFKELTGTSRKNAIPLLEHLDAVRVTRRVGSDREILPPPGG
ncbi:MAG TPA: selenocysteine-specific translation elongation factor [Candidatus Polarisedimenticolia bacterium]|jgi:selenocysteine-specific elongation factor